MVLGITTVLLLLLFGSAVDAAPTSAPSPQPASLQPSVVHYDLNVTLGLRSPDCFSRPVILVNNQFLNTTLEVQQGQILEVTVFNNLPEDFPVVTEGISVHWHGLSQRGSQYMDGVAYITQCPIAIGSNFTYRFTVTDTPGTYLWHGHAGMERVDGLQGALIIKPAGTDALAGQYDEDKIILMTDWYHDLYGPLAYANARPLDEAKITNTSGARVWVDLPQSVLINGQGFYGDCALLQGGNSIPPLCNVTTASVPAGRSLINPQTTQANQGCSHYNLTVEPGKRYRLRVINLASLLMLSFAVEGHNLTIVAADGVPTDPLPVSSVDVNSGQRYDVILTANAQPRTYYLLSQPQYRPGSPSGYGFLTYSNSNVSQLPPTPTPAVNATAPWTIAQTLAVTTPQSGSGGVAVNSLTNASSNAVPQNATVNVFLNNTQPITENGQLHWAFNDITMYKTPGCRPLLPELAGSNSSYVAANQIQTGKQAQDFSLKQTVSQSDRPQVYLYGQPSSVLSSPVSGQYIVPIKTGDIVEVVIQNLNGNASNGDVYNQKLLKAFAGGRANQEQHPFHLHGYHFWVVGMGDGLYNSSAVATYNLKNPVFRDVVTLPRGGWVAIRFIADNPGTWQLHCHLTVHLYMGQQLIFAESMDKVGPPPAGLPACPASCTANFAGWGTDFVDNKYGDSGFL